MNALQEAYSRVAYRKDHYSSGVVTPNLLTKRTIGPTNPWLLDMHHTVTILGRTNGWFVGSSVFFFFHHEDIYLLSKKFREFERIFYNFVISVNWYSFYSEYFLGNILCRSRRGEEIFVIQFQYLLNRFSTSIKFLGFSKNTGNAIDEIEDCNFRSL